MVLTQQITQYIAACFTGLWVQSHEHEDALAEIAQLCREKNWRLAVWDICLNLFELDADQPKPKTSDWTGAEIRSCCRLAALLDVPLVEAAKHVVPVTVTAEESVKHLRAWASGRCLDADLPEIYSSRGNTQTKTCRSIPRDPSLN